MTEGTSRDSVCFDQVVPLGWRKMFSLCDQDGDPLLILETSVESTTLLAGSLNGIVFELFRSYGLHLTLKV
jgi:hypothetical protein